MKKKFKIVILAILISTGISQPNEAKSQSVSVSFSVFYNSLKPYGRWMNHPTYGQIWVSNTKGFVPYSTAGHWAYTDYGWTWVSDYDWGWAPFHYGRWNYHASYGWYWVPGYEWAPAWVAWRNNNDYYGWAPLSPGLTIGVSVGNTIPYGRWVFTPHRYITSPQISRYYVPRTRNVTIIKNTTVINNVNVRNNVHYVSGPKKQDVERVNKTTVRTYTVSNSSRPGKTVVNNNTVNVYRPVINDNDKTVVTNNKTTVNKNSNNTTINKNSNNEKTTVTKNSNNKSSVKETNKTIKEPAKINNETVKKPKATKKPSGEATRVKDQKAKPVQQNASKAKPGQDKPQNEVVKKKPQHNDDNNRRKK